MTRLSTFVVGAMFLGAAVSVTPAAGQDLPAAQDLVVKYQTAIGGADALAGHQAIHSVGEMSIPAAGLTAQIEAWQARPNRTAMRATIEGLGEIRSGYTGEVAWSLNPMEGPRVMEGKEAAQTADESGFDWQLRRSEGVASMTTVELTAMGERPCYMVRVEWKSGRESFDCYSTETGLIVGSKAQQETNMGLIESTTIYDDYREFGGVMMPARVTINSMGMDQIITIRDVTFGDVAESTFAPPAEIQALIKP